MYSYTALKRTIIHRHKTIHDSIKTFPRVQAITIDFQSETNCKFGEQIRLFVCLTWSLLVVLSS